MAANAMQETSDDEMSDDDPQMFNILSPVDAEYGDSSASGSNGEDGDDEADTDSDAEAGYLENEEFASISSDSDDYSSVDSLSVGSGYTTSSSDEDGHEDLRIPFMDLLPELRMNVYAQALIRPKPILPVELCPNKSMKIYNFNGLMPEPDCWERRRQPPLLRVCRQIRQEALPIYYRENVFNACNTVLSAGCMYPMYRYPRPELAEPLRLIRRLHMIVTVVEKTRDEFEQLIRVTFALAIDVSLVKRETAIAIHVISGRAEKKQGRGLGKYIIKSSAIKDLYRDFLISVIKRHMGDGVDGRYDGFNLLRAAAMLPAQLKCSDPALEWRKLLHQTRIVLPI